MSWKGGIFNTLHKLVILPSNQMYSACILVCVGGFVIFSYLHLNAKSWKCGVFKHSTNVSSYLQFEVQRTSFKSNLYINICTLLVFWCVGGLVCHFLLFALLMPSLEKKHVGRRHAAAYIQKAGVLGVRTPQIILIFRKVIVWKRENYQICSVEFRQEEQ